MTDLRKTVALSVLALSACLVTVSVGPALASVSTPSAIGEDRLQHFNEMETRTDEASGSEDISTPSEASGERSPSDIVSLRPGISAMLPAARSSEENVKLTPQVTDPNYSFTIRDSPDQSEIWIDVTDWYTAANAVYNSTYYPHKECSSGFLLLFNGQKINSIGATTFEGRYNYYSSGSSELSGDFKKRINFSMGSSSISTKKNYGEFTSVNGGSYSLYHMYMRGSGMYNVGFIDCPGDYWDGAHQETITHPRTSDSCSFYAGPADTTQSKKITLKWTVSPITDDDLTNERPLTRNCFRIKIDKKQLTNNALKLTGIKAISFFGSDKELVELENNNVLKEVSYRLKGISTSEAAPVLYTDTKKAKKGASVKETPRAVAGYKAPAELSFTASEGYEAVFKYEPLVYKLTYAGFEEAEGLKNENPESFTVEDELELTPASREDGFNFTGWYDESGKRVYKIAKGSTGDKKLTARWSADIKDNNDGTYTYNSGRYKGKRYTYGADGEAGFEDDHEVMIGEDGAWGTSDDYYSLNTDGNHRIFKGNDNKFVTPSTDPDDYYDNSRYSEGTYVTPGENRYFEMDEKAPAKAEKDDELWWSGPDGVTGSDDDLLIKGHRHNSSGNLYVSGSSYIEKGDGILKPGKDLVFGTDDDLYILTDGEDAPYIDNENGTVTRPGEDGEFMTGDDELWFEGADGIPGTEDDRRVYPGEDEKLGTGDDYYINDEGNKIFPGEDGIFGTADDVMQKGDEYFKPGPDGIFGTEDDEKTEKPKGDSEGSDNSGDTGDSGSSEGSGGSGNSGGSENTGTGGNSGNSGGGSESNSSQGSGEAGSSGSKGKGHSSKGSSGGPNVSNSSYVASGPGAVSKPEAEAHESDRSYVSAQAAATASVAAVSPDSSSGDGPETGSFSSDAVIDKVFGKKRSGQSEISASSHDSSTYKKSGTRLPSIPKTGDEDPTVFLFTGMVFFSVLTVLLFYRRDLSKGLIKKNLRNS